MKALRRATALVLALSLAGCAAVGYTLVAPGTVDVGGLRVTPGTAWNLAPSSLSSSTRKGSQVWTQDGLLLDRLIIIPGVPGGESIFVSRQQDAALPVFRSNMLPNEIEELTESSISKQFGEGGASVSTSNLRPHSFGEHRGILFNLAVAVSDGPDYGGLAGAFVVNDSLHLLLYFGAQPYYYDKQLAEAETVITGARLASANTG